MPQATEKLAHELARYAELNSRAVSDPAKGLLDMLLSLVEDQERLDGKPNQRGAKTLSGLRIALESFLGDLLLATKNKAAEGWCYRTTRPEDFTGERVSHRNFIAVVGPLVALGYVERLTGKQRGIMWSEETFVRSQGFATRFRASSALLKLAMDEGIVIGEVEDHFVRQLPQKTLQLRASSQKVVRKKIKGKLIRIKHNETSLRLEAQVRQLNDFLDSFDIRGGTHKGYRRNFNEGDHEDFNWNRGGRLYGGENSYQRMKKEERLRMTIGGSPVVEIDVSASYLTMLHGLSGVPFDPTQDPYAIEGIERRIVKAWATATLGNHQHLERWPASVVDNYKKKTGRHLPSVARVREVGQAMKDKHPILRDWGSLPINWAVLMFHESDAMVKTMLDLMARGVPSLVVHDSLIVRAQDQEMARRVLVDRYTEVAGLTPEVKVSVPAQEEIEDDLAEVA